MKNYLVFWTKTLSGTAEVEASSSHEATEKLCKMIDSKEYIIEDHYDSAEVIVDMGKEVDG